MNPLIRFFRGTANLHITGISAESFLNLTARHSIHPWGICAVSEIEFTCTAFFGDVKKLRKFAKGFDIDVRKEKGFPYLLRLAKRRPVFLLGLTVCVLLLAILPHYVWTIQIEGNVNVPTERIEQVIDALGVRFGTGRTQIDSKMLKMRAMHELPELSWFAIGKNGGCVTILVSEREIMPDSEVKQGITNVIAERDGIISKTEVYGGFRRCKVGDAVREGEILISGVETFEKSTQLTHAYGEIYALTQRKLEAKLPTDYTAKEYTGKVKKHYSLILGRKRINLYGNSGILQGSCDKIIRRSRLELPGGYCFPVWLEEETCLYYRKTSCPIDRQIACERLEAFAKTTTKQKMIAGTILASENKIKRNNGCWVLSSELSCEEMISKTVPVSFNESETDDGGTDH